MDEQNNGKRINRSRRRAILSYIIVNHCLHIIQYQRQKTKCSIEILARSLLKINLIKLNIRKGRYSICKRVK